LFICSLKWEWGGEIKYFPRYLPPLILQFIKSRHFPVPVFHMPRESEYEYLCCWRLLIFLRNWMSETK
jgi:hypothetical protein